MRRDTQQEESRLGQHCSGVPVPLPDLGTQPPQGPISLGLYHLQQGHSNHKQQVTLHFPLINLIETFKCLFHSQIPKGAR